MHAWEKLVVESGRTPDDVRADLAAFRVETPSWGYANTGTRFGKFLQVALAGLHLLDTQFSMHGKRPFGSARHQFDLRPVNNMKHQRTLLKKTAKPPHGQDVFPSSINITFTQSQHAAGQQGP